ncbi:alpha-galactosidase [Lacticaseibacillus parakribbianus]|uniref:alpha-galactosidase n=1 Tax=Lacticaseibacillus parakribbianus TaxID=2970927 RepID=UPI0021CB2EF3|nr:alpha-galactosidase [Lacticaseibacillus parakribbianus]
MTVVYHKTDSTFHLTNAQLSYVLAVLPNGQLGQVYFGPRIPDREHLSDLIDAPLTFDPKEPDANQMDQVRQEYPTFGTGDMRTPAFEVAQPSGSHVTNFTYQSHAITPGKPRLAGLPATYVEDDSEATTLAITLHDAVIDATLVLSYTIYEHRPVITRNARFEATTTPLTVTRAASLALDLPDQDYELMTLTGAWARERAITTRPVVPGIAAIQSLRGHSSAQFNPFMVLRRPHTTEFAGDAIGLALVYSGNFQGLVDADTMNKTRVVMGIHPDHFAWRLDVDGALQTPEVVMVYATHGLNAMSQAFHDLFAHRLARGPYRDAPRPILLNNWEATYFDFDEAKLLGIARTAKKVGVELFVLDDGWFGERHDDQRALGDWQANLAKLPGGITGLADKITELGLKFGLWFEPEMVNPDSNLFRAHPEWVLRTPDRVASVGRHQYVLDFSKPEVVDALYQQMSAILGTAKVSYVKWDMNRSLTEVFSQGGAPESQGSVYHRFILGVYALYERLIRAFPDVLFESCASGGARFDAGMLYYAPQAWASDDTDAVARQKIQYGTSLAYPLSAIGSHVSAVPNHQVGRITPLTTRANVAYFGTFGYELDLNKLSAAELAEVSRQVAFMKAHRELIQYGTFYRLLSPFDGDETAWLVVAKDQKTALLADYRTLNQPNQPVATYLHLQGLDPALNYRVNGVGSHAGAELMNAGLRIATENDQQAFDGTSGDFQSRLYELTAE